MRAFRFRVYGSPDWTEVLIEGELEGRLAAGVLDGLLAEEDLHVQERFDGEWDNASPEEN